MESRQGQRGLRVALLLVATLGALWVVRQVLMGQEVAEHIVRSLDSAAVERREAIERIRQLTGSLDSLAAVRRRRGRP